MPQTPEKARLLELARSAPIDVELTDADRNALRELLAEFPRGDMRRRLLALVPNEVIA